ncbi:dTDP-glucose 4,6-dehydratase [Paenibacillus sp. 598K]|uniref:dTDP-glucose 4,6-dehydratase n=1 Tax=Paenibacillus sp. 598K TaxID=1117987 RepID=UPI000FF96918|nr:dTDP-glucose 4,6-dehydratase [Paenibacillus sp. 598K]GBF77515.1 dTDP-glucose 4,6-dehydratase [Paenibacillus sp. 598K]
MARLLVTGGMGFIGSNFILQLLQEEPDAEVVNLDALTYAGNPDNLRSVERYPRYRHIRGNICDRALVDQVMGEGIDAVVHFAAESHVDRSIADPRPFIDANVVGTQTLLEAARRHGIPRFLHISTDEVYGTLGPTGYFTETSPLMPNSPYSASKAGSDLIARAYSETYGLPVIITRCSNNYGPRQYPEKLIPLTIIRALQDQSIPVYGDGLNIRDWLHVEDHCRAIRLLLERGTPGEVYNIGGHNEHANLEIVRLILQELGKPESLIQFVADRAGHDRRYAIDAGKMSRELGWMPQYTFAEGLRSTVEWYVQHPQWWRKLLGDA